LIDQSNIVEANVPAEPIPRVLSTVAGVVGGIGSVVSKVISTVTKNPRVSEMVSRLESTVTGNSRTDIISRLESTPTHPEQSNLKKPLKRKFTPETHGLLDIILERMKHETEDGLLSQVSECLRVLLDSSISEVLVINKGVSNVDPSLDPFLEMFYKQGAGVLFHHLLELDFEVGVLFPVDVDAMKDGGSGKGAKDLSTSDKLLVVDKGNGLVLGKETLKSPLKNLGKDAKKITLMKKVQKSPLLKKKSISEAVPQLTPPKIIFNTKVSESHYLLLLELFTFIITHHAMYSKTYLQSTPLLPKSLSLLFHPKTHIKLGAVKVCKSLLQDEFYKRVLIRDHGLEMLLFVLIETKGKDTLLNSALLEIFETIRTGENMKSLIINLCDNYQSWFGVLEYTPVFKGLMIKYEQYCDEPSIDRYFFLTSVIKKTVDRKEEMYFEKDDVEDNVKLEFVRGRPLVPYGFEEEEEDDMMGKKIVRKKALVSFAIGNKSEDAKEGASKKRRMQ
jgi:hypothetical protein